MILLMAMLLTSHRIIAPKDGMTPLWMYTLPTLRPSPPQGLSVNYKASSPHVVLLENGGVVALDRTTGTPLWQRSEEWKALTLEARPGVFPLGKGKRWRVIGTARAPREVVVLESVQHEKTAAPDNTRPSMSHAVTVFYGVEARTGRVLWEGEGGESDSASNTSSRVTPLGVFSGLFVAADGQQTELREAATGVRLNPATPDGQAALRRLTTQNGATDTFVEGWWIHITPGEQTPVTVGRYDAQVVTQDVIVRRKDTDGDQVGGSLFPKYLFAEDRKGRVLWQFPSTLTYMPGDQAMFARPESRIGSAFRIANTDLLETRDDAGNTYALRIRDGKVMWKLRQSPSALLSAEPSAYYRGGYFGIVPLSGKNFGRYALAYQDARIGKVSPLVTLPRNENLVLAQNVWVDGDHLMLQVTSARFACYSISRLLSRLPSDRIVMPIRPQGKMPVRRLDAETVAPNLAPAIASAPSVRYKVTALDNFNRLPLPDSRERPMALNNRGQACGWAQAKAGKSRACLWQNGNRIDLGTLGGENSGAVAINDLGQITGWADTGKTHAYGYASALTYHAFLWQNGNMADLGAPKNAHHSAGLGINNRGQILGMSISLGPLDQNLGGPEEASVDFLWEQDKGKQSKMRPLPPLFIGACINNRGQIAGSENIIGTKETEEKRIVIRRGQRRKTLPVPGRIFLVRAVNDHAQILAQAFDSNSEVSTVCWTGRRWRQVGQGLIGTALNNAGQAVGSTKSNPDQGRAFLWQNGARKDLNTLIAADSGWTLHDAKAINDRELIVGTGTFQGQPRAFLLTPIGAKQAK